jgi:NADPH:quinone reductase-like Zn-dependent oxidoreductase
VPGLEAGGIIDKIGTGVSDRQEGQRVILGVDAPRHSGGGTYRTHIVCPAEKAIPAPDAILDDQLGAVWLPYLTAWGCLVWKQKLRPGQTVAIPAASSSVGLAAAQMVKVLGGRTIGLTSSPHKVDAINRLDVSAFDHLVVTHDGGKMRPFHKDLKSLTGGDGVDIFFDPVAAGAYLDEELLALAQGGTIWVYGLLGEPGIVNVQILIRKSATIAGWMLTELAMAGPEAFSIGYKHILSGFADGSYRQHVGGTYRLDDVRRAHEEMERGRHIGKLVLVP